MASAVFSKPAQDFQNLEDVGRTIERGEWFKIGSSQQFPLPLQMTTRSCAETYVVQDKDRHGYFLFLEKGLKDAVFFKIADDLYFAFEAEPKPFIRIQPLDGHEARRIHNAAKASFESLDVWYV